MKEQYFSLEPQKYSKFVRVLQILLGIACLIVSLIWVSINIKMKSISMQAFAPIIFVVVFGVYEICAGLEKTSKFLDIKRDGITFKQYSIFPPKIINATDLTKINIYPLSIIFVLKDEKNVKFRFGTSYHEVVEPVKDAIESFAENISIPVEYFEEKI
ncbi:MAG: hypothetical protein J6X92_02490 [Bacteroidales bacterium]|nr:hypothetical protein [Bacteroidales bacterium]